jgi:hypothetical protein
MNWCETLLNYPNGSQLFYLDKSRVNDLFFTHFGVVTPLEFAIRKRDCTLGTIWWMIHMVGAIPGYIHLAVAQSERRWDVVRLLHWLGVRFVSFDGYYSYLCNVRKFEGLTEEELVEFALHYPQYWSQRPDRDIIDLPRIVALARHRQHAALSARLAIFALKHRIGKDMVQKITGYMKERHYVANEQWGEPREGFWILEYAVRWLFKDTGFFSH